VPITTIPGLFNVGISQNCFQSQIVSTV